MPRPMKTLNHSKLNANFCFSYISSDMHMHACQTQTNTHTHTHTHTWHTHHDYTQELYGALDRRHDLKWKFPKEKDITGVYDDFSTLVPDSENKAETTPIVSLPNHTLHNFSIYTIGIFLSLQVI